MSDVIDPRVKTDKWFNEPVPLKLTYFDRKPLPGITADQVRLNRELTADVCSHGGAVCCDAKRLRWVLEELHKHPGVWSTAKAVIEAALEA